MPKFASKLPNDDRNGLDTIANAFVDDPKGCHVIVALVDCKEVTTDVDTGAEIPTLRFRAVEGFRRDSRKGVELRRLWRETWEARTGNHALPLEVENDFDDIDE